MDNTTQTPVQTAPPIQTAQIAQPSTQSATYKKGPFWHRTAAYLIDACILFLINIVISIVASTTKHTELNFLTYLMAFLYGIFFIGNRGATPGMMVLKLKVLNTNYQKIGYSTALVRTLASILSGIALDLGYWWVLIDHKRQTWHDKLSHTYVVKLDAQHNLIPVNGDEQVTTGQKVLFVLAALALPGIGILAVLAAITLIAINPAKQFSQANNVKRESDINAIVNAVLQYKATHNDQLPQGITSAPQEISSQEVNLCSQLVPTYVVNLPVDPSLMTSTNNKLQVSDCQSTYDTGYVISMDAQGRITVSAPKAQLNTSISVTR